LPEVANALANLGRAEQRLGDFERAGQLTLEALRLQVAVGDYNSLIGPLVLMVYFEFDAGQPAHELGQPLGYLTGGELSHGSVTAARLLGVMGTWQDKVVGRHTVQWDAFVTPLCEKLSAEMGEANFEREFQAGKAMSVEEIVELAETVVPPPTTLQAELDVNPLDVSSAPPAFHASPAPVVPPNQSLVAELTQREIEVLRLVAAGLTNAQAAEQLSVTPRTINAHLTSIYSKTGVTSRAGAVRFAIEHRLA
jgi:DNA-binding CsgD family transcriptional regulator